MALEFTTTVYQQDFNTPARAGPSEGPFGVTNMAIRGLLVLYYSLIL